MNPACTHFVKWREPGKRRYMFLTPSGCGNFLRVHAAQFTEANAVAVAGEIRQNNPGFDAKAVPMSEGAVQS